MSDKRRVEGKAGRPRVEHRAAWAAILVSALIASGCTSPPATEAASAREEARCIKRWNSHADKDPLNEGVDGGVRVLVRIHDGECAVVVVGDFANTGDETAMLFLQKGGGYERYGNYDADAMPEGHDAEMSRDGRLSRDENVG